MLDTCSDVMSNSTAYSVFSLIIELRAIDRSLSDVPDIVAQYPCIVACLLQEWTFGYYEW